MKRNNWFLGLLICVFIFGIFIVSCDSSDGVVNPVTTTTTYSGTSGDTTYTLVVTGLARAVAGDTYVLTVVKSGVSKKSSGTIATVTQTGFTLKPNSSGSQNFTLTFSGTTITSISGTISYDNGTSEAGPGSFSTGGDIPGPTNPGEPGGNPGDGTTPPSLTEIYVLRAADFDTGNYNNYTTTIAANDQYYIRYVGNAPYEELTGFSITVKSDATVVSNIESGFTTSTSPIIGNFSFVTGRYTLPAGTYTIEVYVVDATGNKSNTKSIPLTVTDQPGGNQGGSLDPALNGTWVQVRFDQDDYYPIPLTFNNGNWSARFYGEHDSHWGTYTTSGSNLTMTATEIYVSPEYAAETNTTPGWKNRSQCIEIFRQQGYSDAEIEDELSTNFFNSVTFTYSINGDILTLMLPGSSEIDTYRRQ